MKIAIVAPGRFHAFDLTSELLHRGHDVRVLTGLPRPLVRRHGVPEDVAVCFGAQGLLAHASTRLRRWVPNGREGRLLLPLFGAWAARRLAGERWDVVHVFSGAAEEILRAGAAGAAPVLLGRFSAHIGEQALILAAEARRTGRAVAGPTRWIIAREEREYALSSHILVPSSFALDSFRARGLPAERLLLLPLGADTSRYQASQALARERSRRIRSGQPLRLLYAGALSLRKGIWDLRAALELLAGAVVEVRLAGGITRDARGVAHELATDPRCRLLGHLSQPELASQYAWADLFVFPTLQDGYPIVLAQAQASGLPILTTTNCSGPDIIRDVETGWVVPIRSPGALAQRIHWAEAHRDALALMADRVARDVPPRRWTEVARDFEHLAEAAIASMAPPFPHPGER